MTPHAHRWGGSSNTGLSPQWDFNGSIGSKHLQATHGPGISAIDLDFILVWSRRLFFLLGRFLFLVR